MSETRSPSPPTAVGVEPYLLTQALQVILAQRLVRRLCPQCKKPAKLTDQQRKRMGAAAEGGAEIVVFPELCVTGFPPRDLLLDETFVDASIAATDRIAQALAGSVPVLVGTVLRAPELRLGESVAVNGVCLTVVERGPVFRVEIGPETAKVTSLETTPRGLLSTR